MMTALQAAGVAPGLLDGIADSVTVLVLLVEFGMLRSALFRSQVKLYAVQSLAVSALALVVAIGHGSSELYLLAVVSFLLKVVLVPLVMLGLLRGTSVEISASGALGVASEILIGIVVSAFGFFTVGSLGIHSTTLPTVALSISVAVILVAFVLMILRRDAISQAIGFFSLENGVSVASLVVAAGMPLILEIAFLFDLLVAVVAFGVIIRVQVRRTGTYSTVELNRLRG